MAGHGKGAVFKAMIGNAFLTIVKFIAFGFSRSGAMFSEAVHSLADTSNQALLFIGIRKSQKQADDKYHYGYGGERYLYALLSAVGIFILGAGVTIYHGVDALIRPHEVNIGWLDYSVLVVSIIIDGWVFLAAIREVNAERGDMPFREFVKSSTDPTLVAVLFEDFVAVAGCVVAIIGLLIADLTGIATFDAITSILVGLLLAAIALWLGLRNRELILGPSIPGELQGEVIEFLKAQPSVDKVRYVRTRIAAADRFTLAAEIDYNGHYLGRLHKDWVDDQLSSGAAADDSDRFSAEFGERMMDSLAQEVDRIEAALRERFPKLNDIALESDYVPNSPAPLGAEG